jgi:hypothetical protein
MYVLYYASMLQCWHLVWIMVRTDHPCLGWDVTLIHLMTILAHGYLLVIMLLSLCEN